jgi:hypothetical protein
VRILRRCLALLALVVLAVASSAGAASPAASAAKKKSPCVRAHVGGKSVCLRLGARCDRGQRTAYLGVGLDCIMRKGKRVLAKASPAAVRQGRYIALPASGEPTLAQALAAFDATVADLPGVHEVPGLVGDSASGTAALTWLYDRRDELTPAQRAVLDEVITPGPDAQIVNIDADGNVTGGPVPLPQARASRPGGRRRAHAAQADPAGIDRYTQIVLEAVPKMQAHGLVIRHPVVVNLQSADIKVGTDQANTWPVWLAPRPDDASTAPAGGAANSCLVNVYPRAQGVPLAYMRQILVHELTHCAQDEFLTSIGQMGLIPRWVSDGTAEYVAYTVSQEWNGGVTTTGWWIPWLRKPRAGLFTRSYDGVGFFSLIAQYGANVFNLLGPLVTVGSSAGAYRLAEQAAGAGFASNWGTTLGMVTALGGRWVLDGPGTPRLSLTKVNIANGGSWKSESAAKGADVVALNVTADILHLTISSGAEPKGTLLDPGGTEHPLVEAPWYCVRDDGCKCPGKPDPGYPKFPAGLALLGYANPESATSIEVTGEKLDCKKDDESPDSGGGGGGGTGKGPGLEVRSLAGGSELLGRITSGSCGFIGNGFRAKGTGSGYRFEMRIAGARRPGQFTIPNNDSGTYVKVSSGGGTYSTLGRNTEVLGTTGPRVAGVAIIRAVRVKQGKRTVTRYRIGVIIDDLVRGGKPGVALIPGRGGLLC